jgi:phosphate starvation-inducible PhoH-like protein
LIEKDITLEDINPIDFYGVNNVNLDLIRNAYPDLKIIARGNALRALGDAEKLVQLCALLETLIAEIARRGPVSTQRLNELLDLKPEKLGLSAGETTDALEEGVILRGTSGNPIRAKTPGQQRIVEKTDKNDIIFALGPAGTGKTYTAVALAVRALKEKRVRKIVLCRPAVEAGESLGFLPGDMKEKIDPFLRPLYDALGDMIHSEKLKHFMEKNIIEIVPLAYMRGRTLNNAFVILDEAQNATELQLKMFLTRLGMESKIIVTGDMTQVDLPRYVRSGLHQCREILQGIKGIGFVELDASDVVRHRLVKEIIAAYEKDEASRPPLDPKERDNYHPRRR